MSKQADKVKEAMKEVEAVPEEKFSRKNFLSSGSTLLNMALSGNPFGGFQKGCYYYLVGDSSSGKTFLSLTCFAEATIHPSFKKHRLIYDNVENGALMNMEKFFGKTMADKLESPAKTPEGADKNSDTIEDFYYNFDDAIKDGRPFIYVLDSMDSLTSEKEAEEFTEGKKLNRAGKEGKGSYGDGKAKKNSSGMRVLVNKLQKTDSIFIMISQTRDNIGFGFEKKTRSGGRALKFYATCEIWSSIVGTISKTVKGIKRNIGKELELAIKKNRQTGREWKVRTTIYPSYGIDDMESCVEYLITEGVWKGSKAKMEAPELEYKGSMSKLIDKIEEEGLESKVRGLVGSTWMAIEEACSHKRKKRYD